MGQRTKKIQLLAAAVFCAGKPLGLILKSNWKAIKRSAVLAWHGPARCLFKKKTKKKRSPLLYCVSLASAGRSLAVLLIPMATWSRAAGSAHGSETPAPNLSKIAPVVWAPDVPKGLRFVTAFSIFFFQSP